jgi:RNA polymerase sigma-70 factor (ECF subfamily)
MDEERFRLFYQQTARPLWSYLARITGDRRHADDLLQETYYRFLRASATFESDEHRQRYLFRIATNLSRDFRRRADTRAVTVSVEDSDGVLDPRQRGDASPESRRDVARALTQLRPRERSLLMLAYVQGWSHAEIAQSLGLKTGSLKAMLWRARRRLMTVMKGSGGRAGGAQ